DGADTSLGEKYQNNLEGREFPFKLPIVGDRFPKLNPVVPKDTTKVSEMDYNLGVYGKNHGVTLKAASEVGVDWKSVVVDYTEGLR
ncbi:MAG: hypothetical protein GY797_21400, partial [Deltaproteobacteria bacterium]|nr:hypothetical protein [Deltaproteobacteria bacterium]